MTCEMEILDPSGHLTLEWDPDRPETVARAREEFERLQAAGFGFFASVEPGAPRVTGLKAGALARAGRLDVRALEPTRAFRPRARRTVAVRPLVGG